MEQLSFRTQNGALTASHLPPSISNDTRLQACFDRTKLPHTT